MADCAYPLRPRPCRTARPTERSMLKKTCSKRYLLLLAPALSGCSLGEANLVPTWSDAGHVPVQEAVPTDDAGDSMGAPACAYGQIVCAGTTAKTCDGQGG